MCANGDNAIECVPSYGPIFGTGGYDFYIASGSNANQDSYSEFGKSYKHPDYPKDTEKANSILAGSLKFQTLEIEVFTQTNWCFNITFLSKTQNYH